MLNMKPAIINADQRHELIVVVLDKQNVPISDLEFGSVCYFKRFVADRAAEHSDGVRRACLPFHIIFDLERDVSFDMALRAFTRPNRLGVGHCSLKNEFSLLNQLLKSRGNHRRGRNTAKRNTDQDKWEKMFDFHVK